MPRRPRPQHLRANRERLDIGLVPVRGGLTAEGPPAPRGLLRITRRAWADYWTSPLAGLVETRTDLMALRRLFLFYDEHERSLTAYRKERLVPGSMGQQRRNPIMGAVAPSDILALEDRFGLSPRSRLELGVILGDAARSLADLADLDEPDDDDFLDPSRVIVDGVAG